MIFTAKNIKDEIDEINPLSLFKLYCPDASLESNCSSPLRKGDTTPSFRLYYYNNTLFFNDFGLVNGKGDIYKFVRLLYNLSYMDAIRKIYSDIKNIKYDIPKKVNTLYVNTTEKSKIVPYYKKPTLDDKNYWCQYLNDLKTLKKFKVYSLKAYKIINNNKEIYFEAGKNTFLFKVGSRYKIYQPNNKKFKYIGNTNSSSIQGWHLLNYDKKKLLLVSSMKEVMVLYELGIQAIAPNSESSTIPPKIMNFLKFYWDIEILYDWDKAGLTNAKKHSCVYNLKIHKLQLKKQQVKDLSDFRKKYGFNTLKNLFYG